MRKELLLGRHRMVLTLAAILLGAFVIFKTRLVEAFMSLVFAGVVPGTGIVLSPDMMLLLAAAALWLLFGILIIRWIILRNRRGRHASWKHAAVRRESVAQTVGKHIVVQAAEDRNAPIDRTQTIPKAPQAAVTPKERQSRRPVIRQAIRLSVVRLRLTGGALGNAATTAGRHSTRVAASLGKASRSGLKSGRAAMIAAALRAAALSRGAGRGLRASWRWTLQRASDLWRWAEPRLWKVDAWLEITVRRIEAWLGRSIKRSPRLTAWRLKFTAIRQGIRALYAKPASAVKTAPIRPSDSDDTPKR